MLPTRLGMASLRQTSRLRKNTGQKRSDSSGARHTLWTLAMLVLVCMLCILPDLAAGEFEEQILQIGGAVQGAQLRVGRQGAQQGLGVLRVEKHGFATHLDPRSQR